MTITNEMAKVIAGSINKEELKKACIKDVRLACNKFDLDSVDFDYCEDSYDYESKVEEEYEEFVKETCAEEDSVVEYLYSVIERIYPEEIDSINLDWLELDAITKEIQFNNKKGDIYKYKNYSSMVFDLGNNGWKSLNESSVYNIWNEYEENQKSYSKYNGSGWSPEW